MSEQTLDRVARALATGMPRRAVMKAAAAAAAGGVLTMISRHEDAEAGAGGVCVNGFTRCGGDGCYNPSKDLCCKCTGERKGHVIMREVLLSDPSATCSGLALSCRA
jgi:hypothetical protein